MCRGGTFRKVGHGLRNSVRKSIKSRNCRCVLSALLERASGLPLLSLRPKRFALASQRTAAFVVAFQALLLGAPAIMPKKKQDPEKKFGEFLERRNFSRAARTCKADEEFLLRGFERWLAAKAPQLRKEFQ